MTCPSCEYNKQRAALWREEAYKNAGHALPQREWVGLTDEEIKQTLESAGIDTWFSYRHAARAIEAKLREKNT